MFEIHHRSLADRAYHEVRSRITKLEIPPGETLAEGQLAAELGLSKTPVREALGRLRQDGFVLSDAKSRYRASPVTIKDTRDLFGMRVLLEGEAAALAAGQALGLADLKALETLQATSYDTSNPESVDGFLEANTRFHVLIGRVSGNQRLASTLELTLIQMERLFRVGLLLSSRADEIVHEHRTLVEAVVAGDADKARAEAIHQVRSSQHMVIDALVSREEVLSMPLTIPARRLRRAPDLSVSEA
jgi:DNA-binding GntR family transcriptional regulator